MERIRETVFEHEEGRDTVTITAAEPWSVSLMRKLKEQHPDEILKRVASERMRKHMEEMRNRRSK